MSRRLAACAAALLLFIISGLVIASPPPAHAQFEVAVSIDNGASVGPSGAPGYSPDVIKVVIGQNNTVVWTNNDVTQHTVTSMSVPAGAQPFDSGMLTPSAGASVMETTTFTEMFTVPGTYTYHCTIHSWMTGTIIVLAAGSTSTTKATSSTTSSTTTTAPEFPGAWLAAVLFAVIAVVMVVAAPRLRPRQTASPGSGTTSPRV